MQFKSCCTCGGYAWTMNGRDKRDPHMSWCPQREEYLEWYAKQEEKEVERRQDS